MTIDNSNDDLKEKDYSIWGVGSILGMITLAAAFSVQEKPYEGKSLSSGYVEANIVISQNTTGIMSQQEYAYQLTFTGTNESLEDIQGVISGDSLEGICQGERLKFLSERNETVTVEYTLIEQDAQGTTEIIYTWSPNVLGC